VAEHVARYLASGPGAEGVYVDPAAFQAFISGGSNVALYEATSAALRERWPAGRFRLLDVGAGDGHALVPALADRVGTVDVTAVEPSDAMAARLGDRLPAATVHATTAQAFLGGLDEQQWDVGESTFAMHAIPTAERPAVLAELARRCDRYVLVDFDVPAFAGQRDPARVAYCAERYEIALAEYEGDGGLVAQGFLIPVLLGGFDPAVPQSTWEQPAGDWADEFRAAGYTTVATEPLCDYPWAPAFVLTAQR
jgi:SAM-dependent methyltransferase